MPIKVYPTVISLYEIETDLGNQEGKKRTPVASSVSKLLENATVTC